MTDLPPIHTGAAGRIRCTTECTANSQDTALHEAEEQSGFDECNCCTWDEGPHVDELPSDQVLARIGAPALFAATEA